MTILWCHHMIRAWEKNKRGQSTQFAYSLALSQRSQLRFVLKNLKNDGHTHTHTTLKVANLFSSLRSASFSLKRKLVTLFQIEIST